MEIFEIVEKTKNNSTYKPLSSNGYMVPLNSREYDYVYRELRYKNAFHFTDINGDLNFLIKINMGKDIERVVKNRKILDVIGKKEGPCIELNIEDMDQKYLFVFNLKNEVSMLNIKSLLNKQKIYLHFIICDEKSCIKNFTALFELNEIIVEKFRYFTELCYYQSYPRIDFTGDSNKKAWVVIFDESFEILDEILEITDKLKNWGSMDKFNVYIEYKDGLALIISGECNNINYIKKEIGKRYKIIKEYEDTPKGKPFFRYDRGMMYFFNSNI